MDKPARTSLKLRMTFILLATTVAFLLTVLVAFENGITFGAINTDAGTTTNNVSAPYDRISESPTPLAAPFFAQGSWSLLNLLCMAVSLVWAMVLLTGLFTKKRDFNGDGRLAYGSSRDFDGDDAGQHKRFIGRLVGIAVGIVSLLVFSLTEDITLSTTWVDHWSPLMVSFLIAQNAVTLHAVICKGLNEEDPGAFSKRLSWGSSPRA